MSAPIRRGHYDRRRPDHVPSCSQCCSVQRNFQIDCLHLIGSCDCTFRLVACCKLFSTAACRTDWYRLFSTVACRTECHRLFASVPSLSGYAALLLAERSAIGCSRQSPHCQAVQHCCSFLHRHRLLRSVGVIALFPTSHPWN